MPWREVGRVISAARALRVREGFEAERASGRSGRVPALLRELVTGRDSAMEAAATRMLIDLRRQSALPLSLALGALDPAAQRKVYLRPSTLRARKVVKRSRP